MRTTSSKRWPRRGLLSKHAGRRGGVALALLACTLGLTGCFSPGFTYVSHRSPDGTLLGVKLPSKWKVYDTRQFLEATNGPISSSESDSIANGEWMNSFSAAPKPNANFFATAETSHYPVGFISARPLSASERDGLSFAQMRAEILGTDPLAASSPDPYNVTDYTEFVGNGGIRGSRLTTNIKLASGATATLSQVVEVDPGTNWIFALAIACTASCWGPNSGEIHQILNSWSVKEIKG